MARRLFLLRHAKSDWANPSLSDHNRPLNARGTRAASKMGKHFVENHISPSAVIASTALRVRETFALMLEEWSYEPEMFFEQSLYLASVDTIGSHVRGLHDGWSDVLLIGHNPGLTSFVSQLANRPLEMPTAAVAIFTSDKDSWTEAVAAKKWELTAHWCPRDLFD